MLSDRQFQYTLVLMYICVKTHNVHRTRNVRFFTFVFSVKGMIAVILILVVAVYQQILSSTEQGFIGLLRGNQTSRRWVMQFPTLLSGWVSHFCTKGRGGPCVFYQPHFQMLRAHPAPILFDQSLIFDIVFSLIRYSKINLLNGDEKSKLRKTD